MIKQALALATFEATAAECQMRCSKLHRSGWVANRGRNCWIPNFHPSDLLLFMLLALCIICNLLRTWISLLWFSFFFLILSIFWKSRANSRKMKEKRRFTYLHAFSPVGVWISTAVGRSQPAKRLCGTYSVGQPPLTCFLHDSWQCIQEWLFPRYKNLSSASCWGSLGYVSSEWA